MRNHKENSHNFQKYKNMCDKLMNEKILRKINIDAFS